MPDDTTEQELRRELAELDAEIAELHGLPGGVDGGGGVRDSEEIATDLTTREEQAAVLGILRLRRETILNRLHQLEG